MTQTPSVASPVVEPLLEDRERIVRLEEEQRKIRVDLSTEISATAESLRGEIGQVREEIGRDVTARLSSIDDKLSKMEKPPEEPRTEVSESLPPTEGESSVISSPPTEVKQPMPPAEPRGHRGRRHARRGNQ